MSSPTWLDTKTLLVVSQSFWGITPIGLFYGWAALSGPIAEVFNPANPQSFSGQHGLFVGVLVLFMSACPLLSLLHVAITRQLITEFQTHALGLILVVVGLCLGCIACETKQLWLWYIGCGLICGFGQLTIFRRVLFQHQMYFNSIDKARLGGGIFGFIIGAWTVIFFLVGESMLEHLSVGKILAVYAGVLVPTVLYPLLTIDDSITAYVAAAAATPAATVTLKSQLIDAEGDSMKKIEELQQVEMNTVLEIAVCDPLPPPLADEEELTLTQLLCIKEAWMVTLFFTTVLTPGWGIKLASIYIIRTFFGSSVAYADAATLAYMTSYAFGRLFAGMIAERIGVRNTYNIFIGIMTALLFSLPTVSQNPENLTVFVVLLCLVGLLYGGAKALFYSFIFDIFGDLNYRAAFSFAHNGFGVAVVIGGISSAYSFSSSASVATGHWWFYAMGVLGLVALVMLFCTRPITTTRPRKRGAPAESKI